MNDRRREDLDDEMLFEAIPDHKNRHIIIGRYGPVRDMLEPRRSARHVQEYEWGLRGWR